MFKLASHKVGLKHFLTRNADGVKFTPGEIPVDPKTTIYRIKTDAPVGEMWFRWGYTNEKTCAMVATKIELECENSHNPFETWAKIVTANFTPDKEMYLITELELEKEN